MFTTRARLTGAIICSGTRQICLIAGWRSKVLICRTGRIRHIDTCGNASSVFVLSSGTQGTRAVVIRRTRKPAGRRVAAEAVASGARRCSHGLACGGVRRGLELASGTQSAGPVVRRRSCGQSGLDVVDNRERSAVAANAGDAFHGDSVWAPDARAYGPRSLRAPNCDAPALS